MTRAFRYGAIKRQLQRGIANEHERHLRQAWIERVLTLLDSDNLITQATAGQADGQRSASSNAMSLRIVWDDPRIAYRRQQLEGSDVAKSSLIDHEFERRRQEIQACHGSRLAFTA